MTFDHLSIPAREVRVGDALSGRGPQVRSLRTVQAVRPYGRLEVAFTVVNGAYTDTQVYANETIVEVIREHA